ncbi:MAG: hypothetical protein WD208_02420 [Dehalococcoidia bacterium]
MPPTNSKSQPEDAHKASLLSAAGGALSEQQLRRRAFLKRAAGAGAVAAALYVVPSVVSIKPQAAFAQSSPSPTPTPTPGTLEGCSPGFWFKAPPSDAEWPLTAFSKNQKFGDVFNLSHSQAGSIVFVKLGDMLPPTDILATHATAAILNASHPDVSYPLTVAAIIAETRDAYINGSPQDRQALKNKYDAWNNLGSVLCDDDDDKDKDKDKDKDGDKGKDKDGDKGKDKDKDGDKGKGKKKKDRDDDDDKDKDKDKKKWWWWPW